MQEKLTRRGLITGLISLAAAPAIVRIESLMPVKVIEPYMTLQDYSEQVLQKMIDNISLNSYSFMEINQLHINLVGRIELTTIPMMDFYK